ncbi:hypothetical protein [Streptomyces sp. NRRL S-337]|uniref:hypothetical protein n=1 Tax=Streptomyces sp. NRRL S-337 TaxID=1463900 RepID=UPI00131D9D2F|nr:hypothetical protein [Streptomyces sp. NRRL S-337]
MTTPSDAGSPPPARKPILRDRRNWIAFVIGLAVTVTGAVLVWPQDRSEVGLPKVPDDFCSFIGKETLAKYVPSPELSPSADPAGAYVNCSARSPSGDVYLNMSLSRGLGRADDLIAKFCRQERWTFDDAHVIGPSETAEFGKHMCGVVNKSQYDPGAMFYVARGGDLLDVSYKIRTGNRKETLPRALELTRLVLAKVR